MTICIILSHLLNVWHLNNVLKPHCMHTRHDNNMYGSCKHLQVFVQVFDYQTVHLNKIVLLRQKDIASLFLSEQNVPVWTHGKMQTSTDSKSALLAELRECVWDVGHWNPPNQTLGWSICDHCRWTAALSQYRLGLSSSIKRIIIRIALIIDLQSVL